MAGEPVAGTVENDPKKRRQIIQGATQAFLTLGFRGASMGEIARIAGVSKGTLYVYFRDKEHLFEACIEEKRRSKFETLLDFHPERPIAEELTRFGTALVQFLTSPDAIMAMRTVVGIAEQMPELGARFYEQGPGRTARAFADFLDAKVAQGVLAIDDTLLAGIQFSDMCQSGLVRPLLFGKVLGEAERKAQIAKSVQSAVRAFLAAWQVRPD